VLILLAICGSLLPACGVEALDAPFTYAKLAFWGCAPYQGLGPSEWTRYWGIIGEGDNRSRGTTRFPRQALEMFLRLSELGYNTEVIDDVVVKKVVSSD